MFLLMVIILDSLNPVAVMLKYITVWHSVRINGILLISVLNH